MNEIYAKQILKIFANNPFDAFNHKQISSKMGAHDKGARQLVLNTILELAEEKYLIEEAKGKYKINPKSINDDLKAVTNTKKTELLFLALAFDLKKNRMKAESQREKTHLSEIKKTA